MRYVVTGGCGFIGSHLVESLVKEKQEVVVIDDLSGGSYKFDHAGITYVKGNILDYNLLNNTVSECDGVFHLAALARVERSLREPLQTFHTNVTGTLQVFEACRINNKKCIFSSSSSVYGQQSTHIMSEELTPQPLSPYALQKYTCELYAKKYYELYKMSVISLRNFNVYGPRQVTEGPYSLVIGKFISALRNGIPCTIYGDGTQTRAYTHVSDVVQANILAMSLYNRGFEGYDVFNIGTESETSVNRLAELIGCSTTLIVPNPRGEIEEMRKVANITKAQQVLNWKPKITIEEGIADLLNEKI